MAKGKKPLTKEILVNTMDRYLFGWEYKEIERASIYGNAKLAGFILGACFIDAMAGFYDGVKRETAKSGSGERFKKFVKKYLKKYDAEKLWADLRCGLVHSYAAGKTYVFTHSNEAGFHFSITQEGNIILNLEDFLSDLRAAYRNLRKDILEKEAVFKRARRRFRSIGIMMERSI